VKRYGHVFQDKNTGSWVLQLPRRDDRSIISVGDWVKRCKEYAENPHYIYIKSHGEIVDKVRVS